MQRLEGDHLTRSLIVQTLLDTGISQTPLIHLLDYIIELFESSGLGRDYYGYHNIDHELAVTYVILLSASHDSNEGNISKFDIKHMYAAALLHDFDPAKTVDKPHEKEVLDFISSDKNILTMMDKAELDLNIVKALILRTTYPWKGEIKKNLERRAISYLQKSPFVGNDKSKQDHYMQRGWHLSVADRIGGYAMGDFNHSMELAKMNAHALAWKPSLIVQRSVAYFEDLLNNEPEMCRIVMGSLPREMRKNFFDTVLSFMRLRTQEITIQAKHTYDNLRFVPTIDTMKRRTDPKFIDALQETFHELPLPLQFGRENFRESITDPSTILNTLRLDSGEVIGFAKGGPLENYNLGPGINDENYSLQNTVFLEPLALRMGYWGLHGGSKMRHLFVLQACSKQYKYLTSFALREVIQSRVDKEKAEFVTKIDPERWDYYRIRL